MTLLHRTHDKSGCATQLARHRLLNLGPLHVLFAWVMLRSCSDPLLLQCHVLIEISLNSQKNILILQGQVSQVQWILCSFLRRQSKVIVTAMKCCACRLQIWDGQMVSATQLRCFDKVDQTHRHTPLLLLHSCNNSAAVAAAMTANIGNSSRQTGITCVGESQWLQAVIHCHIATYQDTLPMSSWVQWVHDKIIAQVKWVNWTNWT